MTEPSLLHESVVTPDEIDSLGHMNVRFYLMRADRANRSLLASIGVREGQGRIIRRLDAYTRFHREQFAGARLNTLGGLIAVEGADEASEICAYFEIRNPDNDQLAATFILRSQLVDVASQQAAAIEPGAGHDIGSVSIEVPDYGRPRSLSLATPGHVSLEELESVVSDEPTPGMMSGRRESIVYAEDCDEKGRLREDMDLMFVLHRPPPGEQVEQAGPPIMRDSSGRRYSWAMIETRSVVWARPMAGDGIVSIGADIATGEKWRQSRRWMFVKESGLLLGVSDSVGICIDLDARKSIPMPTEIREAIERTAVPQYA